VTQPNPVLQLKNASFGYGGDPAVESVTAAIYAGDSLALIGPNGSGKSTLLKGILGLAEQLSGELSVLGLPPGKSLERVGYLPQSHNRDHNIPVKAQQVVGMGLYKSLGAFRRIRSAEREQINAALNQVGLGEHAKTLFSELSGGQQQRVILARSLVNKPQLVLLDEPFNGLDQPNRDALLNTVNELRASGTAIVVSTHDLDLARDACSHVMLLNKVQIGFGPIESTLTLELINKTFADVTVELDHHTVTTTREIG
jgi:manganese/iron transport system ATP-binding protein